MLNIVIQTFDDLTPNERMIVPDNGSGKEYASYLRIYHNGKSIRLESDAMEPEDVKFDRDLRWIQTALLEVYELGVQDANRSN